MKLINPNFSLNKDNIFTLRKKEHNNLISYIEEIVKPVEEIGFTISKLEIKDSKTSSGELQKTIRQKIVIRIQKGNTELDLSMYIPKLIDDNYIVISGRPKIPLFQLYDIPLVTRGKHIKLNTNCTNLMLIQSKDEPYINVTFLSKQIPLNLLMFATYPLDELSERFDLKNIEPNPNSESLYDKFLHDMKICYEESLDSTQDDFITELGRFYSKYNARTKGEDAIYALELIPKIDVLSFKHFKTNSVLDELIYAMQGNNVDDTLFTNKRLRCFEYMVLSKIIKNIFNLCVSCRSARQPKFHINSTQILSDCNVSEIVQFDFSINPIEELTKLSRFSILGPGGFSRENVPTHLRDIQPSMFGRVCPVDTPDRDNCGILQSLVPNAKLTESMRFSDEYLEKQPISIPVSMVPFLEHDDQTRLQMSSSQMRQAISLKNFERPLVGSGCESLYTDQTKFIKVAKKDGEVIYVGNEYIIVQYDDGDVELFNIKYRKIYVEHLDFMNIYVSQGDKIKKGDILAESNFCKNGQVVFGKNLLTAVMSYYGNNYEDGIVISDRLVKDDIFTSVHFYDLSFIVNPNKILLSLDKNIYKPLPSKLEKLWKGTPYAITKYINENDLCSIFKEKNEYVSKKDLRISEVNIFANDWCKSIDLYKDWVESTIQKQQDDQVFLQKLLTETIGENKAKEFINDNNLDKFSHVGKYKIKGEEINGMLVEMYGIFYRRIEPGDKIANRHGNKGVIAKIIEHDKMPMLEDGRHVDICINPLGIISRMNIGQLFEIRLAESVSNLKKHLLNLIEQRTDQDIIRIYLLDYIKIIDNTEGNWYYKQFSEQLPLIITKEFVENFTVIQPPYESLSFEKLQEALAYTGTKAKQKVFDPISKQHLLNEIETGKLYFFRMLHIAEEKLSARGIGPYSRRTLQPLKGKKNSGSGQPQKAGEMEVACLIAHDAPENLSEFFTTKSDCIDLKNQWIKRFINTDLINVPDEIDTTPETIKLLNAYFSALGIEND